MERSIISSFDLPMANVGITSSQSSRSQRNPTFQLAMKKNIAAIVLGGQQQRFIGAIMSGQVRRNFSVFSSIEPGTPPPPPPPSGHFPGSWVQWVFGLVISVIVPFFTHRWTNLGKIKDEVEAVVEETEKMIVNVEEVVETVDKVAKDIAEHLPEGSKLRDAAEFVEGIAEEIDKDAHLAEDFLHEVEKAEGKVESLVEEGEAAKPQDNKDDVTEDPSQVDKN